MVEEGDDDYDDHDKDDASPLQVRTTLHHGRSQQLHDMIQEILKLLMLRWSVMLMRVLVSMRSQIQCSIDFFSVLIFDTTLRARN